MTYVTVGVDGSEGAQRALDWALDEARRLGLPLRVVHAAWAPPELAAYPEIPFDHVEDADRLRRSGEEMIDRMLIEAKDHLDGVDVTVDVVHEPPAAALVHRSQDADRIVVGSRGRGGFASLLLGSVSQQVVAHAHCPVVVIPAGR